MREELLPLFPLPLVLFPRTPLPLHIFEEKYKEMIGEAIATHTEFGIVLSRDQGVVNCGCTATVEQVLQRYPDGRMDILTVGRRRFEASELVEGKAYLQGRVHFFDDEQFEPVPMDVRQVALQGYANALKATGQQAPEPEWDDPQLSFQLARILDDADFRQQLLTLRSERHRMQQLADYFPEYIVRWRHSEHIRSVAPHNGHGRLGGGS
ncbi:MAG: LON peptidase substrate-binding domain-containing protein [Bryobacteraceae bacterium]|nr:LON peptidase substrate-binding domain-containing protein [Bryobacteraceae bacterium]